MSEGKIVILPVTVYCVFFVQITTPSGVTYFFRTTSRYACTELLSVCAVSPVISKIFGFVFTVQVQRVLEQFSEILWLKFPLPIYALALDDKKYRCSVDEQTKFSVADPDTGSSFFDQKNYLNSLMWIRIFFLSTLDPWSGIEKLWSGITI